MLKASGIVRVVFAVVWVVSYLGLGRVFGRVGGPPAGEVKVQKFGFRRLEEWDGV